MISQDRNVSPPVRQSFSASFSASLSQVMRQVEYHCFADLRSRRIDPLFYELCLIIAEVFVLDASSSVKLNGSVVPVSLVQEVFSQLRNEHVRLVFDNFQEVACRVYNKKAYLRTALYNAVFEIEAHFVNGMLAAD